MLKFTQMIYTPARLSFSLAPLAINVFVPDFMLNLIFLCYYTPYLLDILNIYVLFFITI